MAGEERPQRRVSVARKGLVGSHHEEGATSSSSPRRPGRTTTAARRDSYLSAPPKMYGESSPNVSRRRFTVSHSASLDLQPVAPDSEAKPYAEAKPHTPLLDVDSVLDGVFLSSKSVDTPPEWTPPWRRTEAKAAPELHVMKAVSTRSADVEGAPDAETVSQVLNRLMPLERERPGSKEQPAAGSRSPRKRGPGQPQRAGSKEAIVRTGARVIGGAKSAAKAEPEEKVGAHLQKPVIPEPPSGSPRAAGSAACESGDQVAELVAFRNMLVTNYGNLYRAFKAMRYAVSKTTAPSESQTISSNEWEWVVSSHLRYSDRASARRVFGTLDRDGRGEIGLKELAAPLRRTGHDITSLVEFRRRLLEQYKTLGAAFQELEDILEHLVEPSMLADALKSLPGPQLAPASPMRPSKERPQMGKLASGKEAANARSNTRTSTGVAQTPVTKQLFIQAMSVFSIDSAQATHFFQVMDSNGDGVLTMEEFSGALAKVPASVLLQDLRQRLLSRYPSLAAALRETTAVSTNKDATAGWVAKALTPAEFCTALGRLGICQLEAMEMFRACDTDNSGDVSLIELRDALRSVAPTTKVEGFWQRFVAEWPEIGEREGRSASEKKHLLGNLIQDLMPKAMRHQLREKEMRENRTSALATDNSGPDGPEKRNQRRAREQGISITRDLFDLLCRALDISQADSLQIFAKVVEAAREAQQHPLHRGRMRSYGERDPEGLLPEIADQARINDSTEVTLDELMEQLDNWSASSFRVGLMEIVGPARASISALKSELKNPLHPDLHPEEKPDAGEQLAKERSKGHHGGRRSTVEGSIDNTLGAFRWRST